MGLIVFNDIVYFDDCVFVCIVVMINVFLLQQNVVWFCEWLVGEGWKNVDDNCCVQDVCVFGYEWGDSYLVLVVICIWDGYLQVVFNVQQF